MIAVTVLCAAFVQTVHMINGVTDIGIIIAAAVVLGHSAGLFKLCLARPNEFS